MATVTNPSRTRVDKQPERKSPAPDQLRHDRIVAAVTLLVMALLLALAVWLASLGGGGEMNNFDYYYPMIP